MTTLEIIKEVQKQLRLPQATLITESHARLVLGFINDAYINFMYPNGVWDELKDHNHFHTVDGTPTYALVTTGSAMVDQIQELRIAGYEPLTKCDDQNFNAWKKETGVDADSEAQPLRYRIYSKTATTLTVELNPIPDAVYQVDEELLLKPTKLTASGDVPLLDVDTIILGAVGLARKERGDATNEDLQKFLAKLALDIQNFSNSNWGDVLPV